MDRAHSFDETPTPTRFIRNCEDMGLFQDLQLNPFDETFRIAVESSTNEFSNIIRDSAAKPAAEETLNTPKIISLAKADNFQNIYTIIDDDDDDDGGDFIVSPGQFLVESEDHEATCTDKENISEGSDEIEVIEAPIQQNGHATHVKISPPTTANSILSALTSNGANTIAYTISEDAIKNGTFGNFIIQTDMKNNDRCGSSNKQPLLPKTVAAEVKDECGEMPEFIPTNSVKAVTMKESGFIYQLSNARLPTVSGKNVIILPSQNNVAKPLASLPVKAAVWNDQLTMQRINIDDGVREKLKHLLKTNSSQQVGQPTMREGRKRSMTESSIDTVVVAGDKREYSRERNRIAQKRCRLKKKRNLMQMMKETEQVVTENSDLRTEVGNLRAEVAHLKTLLLAHRNCSVTRAMFKADLSAILNNDISDIAEDVEIPVPDSTDDSDEFPISIVNQQQVNQLNHHHHVNHHHHHIHLHAPAKSISGQPEIRPLTQTRKLIFDSKVVPIKPDDRSAGVLHKPTNAATRRSKVVADTKPMQSTEVSASSQWFQVRGSQSSEYDEE